VAPLGIVASGLIVGIVCLACAFMALAWLDETHGRDLDFVEE
jgi:hypothetical protein